MTVLDDLHALVTSPIGWVVPVIGLVIAFGLFCLCVDNIIAAGRRFYLGRRPMAPTRPIWHEGDEHYRITEVVNGEERPLSESRFSSAPTLSPTTATSGTIPPARSGADSGRFTATISERDERRVFEAIQQHRVVSFQTRAAKGFARRTE